ncbi:lipid IV(A) palmitoyltransferase PagP [Propionivibrio sp.]|uniref:lipid IV(A) palmitoyltransferase PagP n=1 Tax=Propionivibrio sp. TaxID=2212460 RepID=UPI003BF01D55
MNFPSRRKPLALLCYYGFASALVSAYAPEALAQAPPVLRIDPALLGLPPIKPGEAPTHAPVPATTPATTPAEKPRVEVKPIEAPVVEARSVEAEPETVKPAKASKAPAPELPERTVAPPAAPVVAKPSRAPAPAEAVSPVVAVPARNPRDEEERQAAPAAPELQPEKQPEPVAQPPTPAMAAPTPTPVTRPVVQQQAQSASMVPSPRPTASPLAPLHVDPALLGPAPAAATAASSQPSLMPRVGGPAPVATAPSVRTSSGTAPAASTRSAGTDRTWYQRIWDPVANAFNNGALEFYLPLETYHSRSTYSAEQIATYQEQPLGFGIGRGLYNEKGNWEGVYAMAFQDSHFKPSYTAGYGWKAIWRPAEDVRLGLGYLAGLMSREDIFSYVPFPIVVPLVSVAYKNFSLEGTYIPPGGQDAGNVLFIWAKWELGKKGEAIGTPARPVQADPVEMANSSFGRATPLAQQKVPYGPVLEEGPSSRLASSAETVPPRVAATGWRDEDEVPDVSPSLALRAAKTMVPPPKDSAVPRPVFLSSLRMAGTVDREFIAEEEAELRKIGTVLNADRLTYWPIDDEVEAEGNVRLQQEEDLITGPKMRLKMEDQVGYFEQPSYTLKRQPQPGSKAAEDKAYAASLAAQHGGDSWLTSGFAAPRMLNIKPGQTSFDDPTKMPTNTMTEGRGEADRIDFEGENQYRMTNGTYTTCAPGNDDWYVKASTLKLDYDREVGEGDNGRIYFLDVPILYSPWLSFSLNNERKSGFLAPSFGTTSVNGIDLGLPYYWNIAPNMDATITPRVLGKRGVQLNNEFRYLNSAYGGLVQSQARVEVLPDDRLRNGDSRYALSFLHTQPLANGFAGSINYNKVSDGNYFIDLSNLIAQTSQVNLLQQGMLSYGGGGWWTATANFQSYQTLQPDPANPNRDPYRMLPQITVMARKPDLYLTDSSFMGQYTNFTRPAQTYNGATLAGDSVQRTVLYPSVALPYVTPGWYVTPKIGVNIRNYALSGQAAGTPDSISSTLPIFSVDSGMTFERPSNWFGRDYTQTLEPRLYYLNVPYKNQDQIPVMDTGLADFNFAQIFSENQFSGWDRINNANQLTAAATSRLIEPSTGNEIMRAMFGQRFYFTPNKVALTPTSSTTGNGQWEKSDILAAFSGQVLPKVFADTALEYNVSGRQAQRFSIGGHYLPEPGKVLNAAYRYNRGGTNAPIDQIDLSGQWPLSGRWHAVGRINYSFKDDATNLSSTTQGGSMIESIAGLEYNGGCWVVRGVVQRIALTQNTTSSGFFIQLELSDFSRIGSSPLDLLKRNVQGYSLINQPAVDPAFGQ